MKTSVKIEGLKSLDEALGEMTKATARSTLYRVLMRAAQPLDAAWRDKAPRKTGRLAESGGIAKASKTVGNAAFAGALRDGGTRSDALAAKRSALRELSFAEVIVGPGKVPEAVQQEFGNVRHAAQPYMRPAWDATKDQALEIVKSDLAVEIEKTRQRAAKRAALKAARG